VCVEVLGEQDASKCRGKWRRHVAGKSVTSGRGETSSAHTHHSFTLLRFFYTLTNFRPSKIMISNFSWEKNNGPNSPDFERKK